LPVIQTLWPGLELVRRFSRARFTLGACTAVRRSDVEGIGGWTALGDELAEDHQLGARFAAAGKMVRISGAVLELDSEPMTWSEYWRHQRRVAVTYRVAAPVGALGLVVTRGFTNCLFLAAAWPCRLTAVNAVLAAVVHLLAVALMGRKLRYPLGGWVWLSLVADVIESACWVLGWVSNRVWWSGKWRRITWRGQFKTARYDAER
jgi:ceramide glucosyltransferase